MKKLLLLPLILLSFLLLTGCNNNPDYPYVDASEKKEMTATWFKDVEFDSEQIYVDEANKPGKEVTRFEIFLPKNIVESTRYVVTDIEEGVYGNSYESVNIVAYSFSNLGQTSGLVLNTVNANNNKFIAAYNAETTNDDVKYPGLGLDEKFGLTFSLTYSKQTLSEFAKKEGENRSIVTAYLPVKVEYFEARDKKDADKKLTTYVILPVTTSLEYTKEGKLAKDSKFNKFDSVELKVKDGLLA